MTEPTPLADFAHTTWDVVVVGAGVAGTMAARECARRGAKTLLVDKSSWPRDKVCGCCLNLRALGTLEGAGLGDLVESAGGQPLTRFRMGAAGRVATVPLPGGMAVSRGRLDASMAQAAVEEGVTFLPETMARLSSSSEAARAVMLKNRSGFVTVTAKMVLAADGLGGKLLKSAQTFDSPPTAASRIGAGAILPQAPTAYAPGTIYMACGKRGYVGLVRIEDGRLDVAAAFDPHWVKFAGGLGYAASAVLNEAGFDPIAGLDQAAWKGTPPLTRAASTLSAHRFLVLGDAAGYVEPFTGEGMAWALASGHAIAPIACDGIHAFDDTVAARWERLYREVITRRQATCRILSLGLRRPFLVRAAAGILAAAPGLARPVVGHLNASPSERKAKPA